MLISLAAGQDGLLPPLLNFILRLLVQLRRLLGPPSHQLALQGVKLPPDVIGVRAKAALGRITDGVEGVVSDLTAGLIKVFVLFKVLEDILHQYVDDGLAGRAGQCLIELAGASIAGALAGGIAGAHNDRATGEVNLYAVRMLYIAVLAFACLGS